MFVLAANPLRFSAVRPFKSAFKAKPGVRGSGLWLAAGVLSAQPLVAGSVFVNQSQPLATAPQVTQDDAADNPMNVFIPTGVVNPDAAGLFQYGPVVLHPHVSYSIQDATGVEYGPGTSQSVVSQQISPGLTANLGRHWTVDYSPTLSYYSGGNLQQSVDQSATLSGATHYENWNLAVSQNFSSTSDPNTQTAAQTSQQSYGTTLSAAYAFNDKWNASFGAAQNISLVSGLQNSYNWSTQDGVNYQFSPGLFAGVSLGGGYTVVSANGTTMAAPNPDIVNETFQVNGGWRATQKISLQGSVGLSDQQYLAAGYGDSLSPIFSLSVQYQPFQYTQIALTGSRTTGASDYFVQAQSMDTTSVNLALTQRLLVKYSLSLAVNYTLMDYTTTAGGQAISLGNARADNVYTFSASFGRSFLTHGNWALTYAYTDDESSLAGFSQRSNQVGFQVGFNY